MGSLPVRERGLKVIIMVHTPWIIEIAPRAGAWIESHLSTRISKKISIAPRAGAWIESIKKRDDRDAADIAPRAGAWIERLVGTGGLTSTSIAPRAGAWIESNDSRNTQNHHDIAPRAGAWIERSMPIRLLTRRVISLPVRERGLKDRLCWPHTTPHPIAPRAGAWIESVNVNLLFPMFWIAPRAGAWIERYDIVSNRLASYNRSPCGSVD